MLLKTSIIGLAWLYIFLLFVLFCSAYTCKNIALLLLVNKPKMACSHNAFTRDYLKTIYLNSKRLDLQMVKAQLGQCIVIYWNNKIDATSCISVCSMSDFKSRHRAKMQRGIFALILSFVKVDIIRHSLESPNRCQLE